MFNSKKILALVLALVLCAGLFTACGKKADDPDASGTDLNTPPVDAESTDTDIPESDLEYIKSKGEMVIGYTDYEPMNFVDSNGELTGFDTEFAMAVCEKLGVEPKFVEIIWETKEIELAGKSIDCIWNGLTIDDDRKANMSISLPYVKNAQVIVVKKDSGITSTADLIGKTVAAEIGSAGEAQLTGEDANADLAQAQYIGKSMQTQCLVEVKAGTADAAVLDWTLAKAMVGEGTDFSDLIMIENLELAEEEYGVAFRKGSDVTAAVDKIIEELVADGTLPALAEKYGLSLAPSIAK